MYDERYAAEQQTKYRHALKNIKVAGLAVLDVGCGSGLFMGEIAPQTKLTVGVDVSRRLLLKAKERMNEYVNADLVQADADHLPFCGKVFGGVFAFTVLQNMPKPAETLSELKRVAAAGGWVVVTGLKKAFALENFLDVLDGSGLRLVEFFDEAEVNCYVAVLAAA